MVLGRCENPCVRTGTAGTLTIGAPFGALLADASPPWGGGGAAAACIII